MNSCIEGKRHKWLFVENRNCRTESLNSIGWTLRGMYKCAVCRIQKYGAPQHTLNTATKEGRSNG